MIYGWMSPDTVSEEYESIFSTIYRMGLAYYYFGKLNSAIKLVTTSQAFVENFTEKEIGLDIRFQLAQCLSQILCVSIFYQNTHLDKVLPTLLLTRQLAETSLDGKVDEQGLSDILDHLGLAYYYHKLNTGEGDSNTSLTYFQQALEIRQRISDPLGESESLFHIGLIYQNGDRPDIDKALNYYNQAYQVASENIDLLAQAYAARHLGSIAETQGNNEQARRYYEESLTLRQKIGYKISLPFSHLALGDLCFTQKEWDSASTHYQTAVTISREMDTPIPLIASLLSLGDLYQAQNESAKALSFFEEAFSLAEKYAAVRWMSEATSRIERLTA